MILVFIILGIIIFISLIMFILILSNIKLEIKKLHISNVNKKIEVEITDKRKYGRAVLIFLKIRKG